MTIPSRPIYLDYHSTTPCDPRVVEAMLPYFSEEFGNPSSGLHTYGRRADQAVEAAREQVGSLIGSSAQEITFTSGATESNNLVIFGVAERPNRRRIVSSVIEHKAVLEPLDVLDARGFEIVLVSPLADGSIDIDALDEAIDEETLLVSIQAANNEIGTIQKLRDICSIAHSYGALVHTDAAQAIGRIEFDVREIGVDFASISGHKMYAPKGVGAMYAKSGMRSSLTPLFYGGGQEFGIRPGTENVPGIVGFGAACEIARSVLPAESLRIAELRDTLEHDLLERIPALKINGVSSQRLPGNLSVTFPNVEADALILNAPELALSTGSACTSGAVSPSHVLTSIGLDRSDADSTVRIGIGRFTTPEDVTTAVDILSQAWLRLTSKLW